MNETGVSGLTVYLAILAPVLGFLGVMVGQWGLRGREVRETRRQAYVEWVQAAQNLAVMDETLPAQGAMIPTLAAKVRLNDATAHVAIVGSGRVIAPANRFLELIDSAEYGEAMSGQPYNNAAEVLHQHVALTQELRGEVVGQMRKDILPWWLPGSRHRETGI